MLDALALAAVTEDAGCVRHLSGRAVLTPNPAELARALHVADDEVEQDPERAAVRLAER